MAKTAVAKSIPTETSVESETKTTPGTAVAEASAKPKKRRARKKIAKKTPATKDAKKKAIKTKVAAPIVEINKSEAIRQQFKKLGKKARPKDVVAALAAQGIELLIQSIQRIWSSRLPSTTKQIRRSSGA